MFKFMIKTDKSAHWFTVYTGTKKECMALINHYKTLKTTKAAQIVRTKNESIVSWYDCDISPEVF